MKKKLLFFLTLACMFSCQDLFEPALENIRDIEAIYDEPVFAQGILLNGYTRIPTNGWSFSDVATDDAVSNDIASGSRRAATGQWTAQMNPFDQWQNSKAAIQYLNTILQEVDKVNWANDEIIRIMFGDRMKGEAHGLRALFMYYLLLHHGGWSEDGQLLGVPILLEPEDINSDFNKPRDTFQACMEQIYSDLDTAEDLLPLDYENVSNMAQIPEKYRDFFNNENDATDNYNRVFGEFAKLRFTGRIAKAVRAQAALLAASPAYSPGNTTTWVDAANFAGDVLELNGGISGIASNGWYWYARENAAEISGITAGNNPAEILWRSDVGESNNLEINHFPPTLFGNGRLNPTQNLVNAFPMQNGYPITDASSNYDPTNPYEGRDPRLKRYILVNGEQAGVNNTVINTALDGPDNNSLRRVETSTRTGYYMKKLLRQDVNLAPNSTTTQRMYKARIRYTEMYLIYAEAANEAWGPLGSGSFGFSAYDVVAALRQRAGIAQPDNYLEAIKSDQNAMRDFIRNERRLELCFEGHRFWDLRRWNLNLNEPARGVEIVGGNHRIINVENRVYNNFMNHGPIPFNEILKFNALVQNNGWR